jgi:putative transposase
MYRWRQMTTEQREAVLKDRQWHRLPWHSPPHYENDSGLYLVTAACFEHRHVIGHSPERMSAFETSLLDVCRAQCELVFAWNVLPNHYHVLVKARDIKAFLASLGRLHGRASFEWNGEEQTRGRQVWCNAAETGMKSERHFWASLLYVLNNAVRHGYVDKWQDWAYCNAREWLESVGRERAEELWREFPIDRYGDEWDPAEM